MSKIGEKLYALRQQQGLTSRQLGEILNVSHGHILRIEKGEKRPSIDLVAKIATFFGVTTDQLIFDNRELDD
jgi:transcriptional regulator with XRE-family HTH domain